MATNTIIRTVGEAPIDGTAYARQDAGWITVPATGVEEAPIDGTAYARQDAGWITVPATGVEEAPTTLSYVRTNTGWVLPTLAVGARAEAEFNLGVNNTNLTTLIPMATNTQAGMMSGTDKVKVDSIVGVTSPVLNNTITVNAPAVINDWATDILSLFPAGGNLNRDHYTLQFPSITTYNLTEVMDFSSLYNGEVKVLCNSSTFNVDLSGSLSDEAIITSGSNTKFLMGSCVINYTHDTLNSTSCFITPYSEFLDVVLSNMNINYVNVAQDSGDTFNVFLMYDGLDSLYIDDVDLAGTSNVTCGLFFTLASSGKQRIVSPSRIASVNDCNVTLPNISSGAIYVNYGTINIRNSSDWPTPTTNGRQFVNTY